MIDFSVVDAFHYDVNKRPTLDGIRQSLETACRDMGFRFYSASHHVDLMRSSRREFRLHNYPASFAAYFEAHRLWPRDPIHRASHLTNRGFRWCEVPDMIKLTPGDRDVLAQAARWGIGEGFTKPAHVPGEARGSVSFAVGFGERFPDEMIYCAQAISDLAFDAARRLHRGRGDTSIPLLTPRQLDCVMLHGRGMTDQQIADDLALSRLTVIEHMRNARTSWGLTKSGLLPLRAAAVGVLCFSDFFL